MTRSLFSILLILYSFSISFAKTFNYKFNAMPLSEALAKISHDHPEINICFIYNELEDYTTSARIDSDNIYDALRQTISLNPVTLTKDGNNYFLEALQHGKFKYHGRVVSSDGEALEGATVLLLNPKDSVAITYGVSKKNGYFYIPCDRKEVIAKVYSLSYKTVYKSCTNPDIGTIIMSPRHVTLKEVSVNADYVTEFPDKTVFIPTSRQKNASLSGDDLIIRMAIPRLKIGQLKTQEGKDVEVFIDYLPADIEDLGAMRMKDIRKVEYYDFPSDPRFMGKPHVINFVMVKYEYGGYLKGYADQNLFYNSGQENIYGKFNYKKMTYDLRLGYYHRDYKDRDGYNKTETFRLPQADGSTQEFHRDMATSDTKHTNRDTWTSFRAVYQSKKITLSNSIYGQFDRQPDNNFIGSVTYSPDIAADTHFSQKNSSRENYFSYNGYLLWYLPKSNAVTFYPGYFYAHTNQYSAYKETDDEPLLNKAIDDTHRVSLAMSYYHWFNQNTLSASFYGNLTSSKTRYIGTANTIYPVKISNLGTNVSYNYNIAKLYGSSSLGIEWQRSIFDDVKVISVVPNASLSLQYAMDKKNRVSGNVSFQESLLPSNYRSDVVIQSNPLMSYTGNPNLKPDKKFNASISYSYHPISKLSLSAYGSAFLLRDRFGYLYEPSGDGILRTISQPLGKYSEYSYGISATSRLLNNNLMLSGSVSNRHVNDASPWGGSYSLVDYSFNANYYVGNCYFTFYYYCPYKGYDTMSGIWYKNTPIYYLSGGWANSNLNIRVVLNKFASWKWKGQTSSMNSTYYDYTQTNYGQNAHCLIKFCVTYTFGFGLKISQDDEVNKGSNINANILK